MQKNRNFEEHLYHYFWILSIIAGSFSISDTRLTRWLSGIVLTCSVISIAPYKESFRALSYHQAQV